MAYDIINDMIVFYFILYIKLISSAEVHKRINCGNVGVHRLRGFRTLKVKVPRLP
jgi:hypothetical protein